MTKRLLNAYYENTIIPAIVLGCITILGEYAMRWFTMGDPCITMKEAGFTYLIYFVIVTIQDAWNSFVSALYRIG